jgi:hypothetical protein
MAKAAKVESLFPPRSHESGEETGCSMVSCSVAVGLGIGVIIPLSVSSLTSLSARGVKNICSTPNGGVDHKASQGCVSSL